MAMSKGLHDYMRSLGISEKEINGYSLSAYNGDRAALKQAIDQAVHNALRSHLSPEEDDGEDESDAYELEDDEDEGESGDVAHLPGRQKRDKAEQRLTETTRHFAEIVGVSLDELRRQAQCGNVAKERQAAAKIQALYREADRFLSE